jgi:competence protein ComEA
MMYWQNDVLANMSIMCLQCVCGCVYRYICGCLLHVDERCWLYKSVNYFYTFSVTDKQEAVLTWMLAGLCLTLASLNLLPRLHTRPRPLAPERVALQVAVQGEVVNPGVYDLAWGATVADLLAAAGGLTNDADANLVNLAAPLDASSSIFVPSRQAASPTGERISINSASLEALDTLPGIGPALAQRIVAARPFNSIDELLDVSGIGEKTLADMRPLVTL